MNLDQAKSAAREGRPVFPDFFGPGWVMVYQGGEYYDRNPVTGSMLLHRFGPRDVNAAWKVAGQ